MILTHCENPVNGWEFSAFSKALAMQLLGSCEVFWGKTVPLGFQKTGPTEAEYSLADSIFNTGNIGNPCHDNFIHEFSEETSSKGISNYKRDIGIWKALHNSAIF